MTYPIHQRYRQQANWTKNLRQYIFGETGLNQESRVLEVGCGTGAIIMEMDIPVYGLDIQLATVKKAKHQTKGIHPLTCADAHTLPYPDASFDTVFSHFLLLWLSQPERALREMRRVTRAGGHIIAFAEPDYTRRVDKPPELEKLGAWQKDALADQGADPAMGTRLAALFHKAGIKIIETGAISKSGDDAFDPQAWALEWEVLETDLRGRIPDVEIQKMKKLDQQAWDKGARVLHVPTHYAWGQKTE